jgi:hypothetical protein
MIGKVVLVGLAVVGSFTLLAVAGWLVLLHATRDEEAEVVTCRQLRPFRPDQEMDLWPDGSPVIVDRTLEPRDFA